MSAAAVAVSVVFVVDATDPGLIHHAKSTFSPNEEESLLALCMNFSAVGRSLKVTICVVFVVVVFWLGDGGEEDEEACCWGSSSMGEMES